MSVQDHKLLVGGAVGHTISGDNNPVFSVGGDFEVCFSAPVLAVVCEHNSPCRWICLYTFHAAVYIMLL